MHAWLFFLIKRYVYFPGLKIFQSNDINQNLQVTKWLHDIYYTLSIVYTFIFMWVYYILYICKFLLMLFYVLNFSTFLYSRFLFMLSLALQVIHLGNSKKHFLFTAFYFLLYICFSIIFSLIIVNVFKRLSKRET